MISAFRSLLRSAGLCAAAVVALHVTTGCSTSSRFAVEARRDAPSEVPQGSGTSYRLTAGPTISRPEHGPAATTALMRDVATALSGCGYYPAPGGTEADIEVVVDLRAGHPVTRWATVGVPVYVESVAHSRAGGESGGPAQPRKIGEQQVAHPVQMFPKHLLLTAWAVDAAGMRGDRALWAVHVRTEHEEENPAGQARLMVAAAMDWIGTSTAHPIDLALSSSDARVRFIARGQDAAPASVAVSDTSSAARGARAGG